MMPTIPYIIEKSVQRLVNGRNRWFVEYETVYIDVSDEVAAFLEEDDKYEQDYQTRMKKLKRKAKIHKTFSLDGFVKTDDGSKISVRDLIADTVHSDNRDPLEIAIAKETVYERLHGIKYEDEDTKKHADFLKLCALKMTKKQYEAWRYSEAGFSNVKIAEILKIDESSVRERIKNALKRIEKINLNYFYKNPRK